MRTPLALALCTSAALALSAGCSPDSPTVAGPTRSSIRRALEPEGTRRSLYSLRERRRYQGSAIPRDPPNVTTPRVRGPTMTSS